MKSKFNRLCKILKNICKNILNRIEKEEWSLMFLCGVLIIIFVALSNVNMVGKATIILLVLFGYYVGILFYLDANAEKIKIPKLKKRLTFRDENANVYIDKDDWAKALMYLSEIEDYIEQQGE